jgi:predicted alpha/beta hydrolase family esterase
MSLFHSGLNHWQRQWLSDRLHKKPQPTTTPAPIPMTVEAPKRRKVSRPKAKPPGPANS